MRASVSGEHVNVCGPGPDSRQIQAVRRTKLSADSGGADEVDGVVVNIQCGNLCSNGNYGALQLHKRHGPVILSLQELGLQSVKTKMLDLKLKTGL